MINRLEDREDEDNSIACDHGTPWSKECRICEEENSRFMMNLFSLLGNGNKEEGRQWLIDTLKRMD